MENDHTCSLCDAPANKTDITLLCKQRENNEKSMSGGKTDNIIGSNCFAWKIECPNCRGYAITEDAELLIKNPYKNQRHFISEYIKKHPVKAGDDVIPLMRSDIIRIIEEGQKELELKK